MAKRTISNRIDHTPKPDPDALPCPFCGSMANIEPWHGGGPRKRLIGCSGEVRCEVSPSVTGSTRDIALKRWNLRS